MTCEKNHFCRCDGSCRGPAAKVREAMQPQPDESDEDLKHKLNVLECEYDAKNGLAEEVIDIIARHTAAKVAAAEERGWNRGAAAMREIDAATVETHAVTQNGKYLKVVDAPPVGSSFEISGKAIRALPLPQYRKEGE